MTPSSFEIYCNLKLPHPETLLIHSLNGNTVQFVAEQRELPGVLDIAEQRELPGVLVIAEQRELPGVLPQKRSKNRTARADSAAMNQ